MQIPGNIDPLQLNHLVTEIDKQCSRLITEDSHAIVDAPAFGELKRRLRDEVVGLFTEILNDMRELRSRLPRPDVLPINRKMPHLAAEFVGEIRGIFEPPQSGNQEDCNEAAIAWHAKRLMWTADIWLLLQIEFFQMLERFSPTEAEVTLTDPNGKQSVAPALPLSGLIGSPPKYRFSLTLGAAGGQSCV